MTKLHAISKAKGFRGELDQILQSMKTHRDNMLSPQPEGARFADEQGEAIAHHTISMRELENAIMRQGMVLKNIGNPDPYPDTKLTVEGLAKSFYEQFCMATGHEGINEAPLIPWEEFSNGPTNQRWAAGWRALASMTLDRLSKVHPTADGLKL